MLYLGLSIIEGKYQIVLFNTIRRMVKLIISFVNCIFYKKNSFYNLWFRFFWLEKHAWQKPCSSPTNITEIMLHSENKSYRSIFFFFFYPSIRVNISISDQLQKDILFPLYHFRYDIPIIHSTVLATYSLPRMSVRLPRIKILSQY